MKKPLKICFAFLLFLGAVLAFPLFPGSTRAAENEQPNVQEEEVAAALNHIFAERAKAMVSGKYEMLEQFYAAGQATAKHAYRHERNRILYVNTWAEHRGLKLDAADSSIRIIRSNISGNTAKVSLVQSQKIGYLYKQKTLPVQFFGVGTRHFLTLIKQDGKWAISREWYLDPLDENPQKIAAGPDGAPPSAKLGDEPPSEKKKYNRKRAVAYADKYAGAAWGAGNRHRYNKKYLDYTGKGGDCTNFSSQAIGDAEEGGGLAMQGGWRYFYGSGGTRTWVQTDSFGHFLLYSGYASQIAKGDFTHVTAPSQKHADGAISKLRPGDLIGYILNHDDIDHFSIVTGFDDNGYPLVNSHTADRYRVPFDLGWDANTRYVLFHIKD